MDLLAMKERQLGAKEFVNTTNTKTIIKMGDSAEQEVSGLVVNASMLIMFGGAGCCLFVCGMCITCVLLRDYNNKKNAIME